MESFCIIFQLRLVGGISKFLGSQKGHCIFLLSSNYIPNETSPVSDNISKNMYIDFRSVFAGCF
jgi:hypothetical protein